MQEVKQKVELLDKFLADNPELEELSAHLSQFNVFRTLRIEQTEIRHSNVLGWLLDPKESHGLSDIVLRRVLSNILLLSDKTIPGLSAAKVELLDFFDIETLREWRNIDIVVIDRTNKIVLFFENKIYSGESSGQLVKYLQIINEEYSGFKIIPVFLTLTGQDSNDDKASDYICCSYLDILSILEKIYEQRGSQITESVRAFLSDYLDTLRSLTMKETELTQLCKSIYRKHRKAIDLIVEHGKKGTGQQAVEDILENDIDYEILSSTSSSVWFIPISWAKCIPENAVVWPNLKRRISICCWIEFLQDRMHLHFELCKMNDSELRLKCVKQLKKAGFKLGSNAFKEKATYSRFFNAVRKVKDQTNFEETKEAAGKLLTKAEEQYPIAEAVFKNVFAKK